MSSSINKHIIAEPRAQTPNLHTSDDANLPQNFKSLYLFQFLMKSLQTKPNLHLFQFSFKPTDQNPLQHLQMEESSRKRKGSCSITTTVGHHRQGTSGDPPAPVPPSLSSLRSSTLFSLGDQRQRYYS